MLAEVMLELRQLSHQVDLLAKMLNEMQQTVQQGLGCQQQHAQLTAPAAAPAAADHDDDKSSSSDNADDTAAARHPPTTFDDAEHL